MNNYAFVLHHPNIVHLHVCVCAHVVNAVNGSREALLIRMRSYDVQLRVCGVTFECN